MSLARAAGVSNGWIGSRPPPMRAGPYMSTRRRGASQGSCASNESTTSANGFWRPRAHSIQPIASRKTFAAL